MSEYEPLESRQLLSVMPGITAASPVASQPIVQPDVSGIPLSAQSSPTGLSPAKITAAYGVNEITFGNVTGTGQGQTIAIIDAYDDPNISSDLQKFDSEYGLSAPPSFTQHVMSGVRGDNAGWALETSLDVEWAHAIAPDASILLVESTSQLTSLLSAVTYAANQPGVSVVSMSWGGERVQRRNRG